MTDAIYVTDVTSLSYLNECDLGEQRHNCWGRGWVIRLLKTGLYIA